MYARVLFVMENRENEWKRATLSALLENVKNVRQINLLKRKHQ